MLRNFLFFCLTISFLFNINLFGQDKASEKVYYSEIEENVMKFQLILTNYIRKKKLEKITIDDSLFEVVIDTIDKTIVNSYFDDYEFVNSNDGLLKVADIKKPIFLMITTFGKNYCSQCKFQIPYFNLIVQKFKNDIDFILLVKDYKFSNKDVLNSIDDNVIIIPETNKKSITTEFSDFKYHLGIPKIFLINREKKIVDINSSIFSSDVVYFDKNGNEVYFSKKKAIDKNKKKMELKLLKLIKK